MVYFSSASLVQSMSVEERLVASLLDPTQLIGNTYSERYCSCSSFPLIPKTWVVHTRSNIFGSYHL